MKVATLAVFVVGCFGRPATITAIQGKEETKTSSPVATQETSNSTPTPESSQAPATTLESPIPIPTPAPVVAQDTSMMVTDIKVGDPALETAIRFSIDKVGTITVQPQSTEGLRLFRVRDDQFGQTELVSEVQGSEVKLPMAGTYLVAGKEKPLPFMDVPLGGDAPQAQYRVQGMKGCPTIPIPDKKIGWGGYKSPYVGTGRLTVDTEYPAKVTVYLHRGAGNSDDPRDNFQNWVDYNQSSSPDKAALAERVRVYVPDPWDSGPSPDFAARKYNEDRTPCGVRGESWIDVCFSAGCQKVWRALLEQIQHYERNNRGIIAAAPVIGGSHWSIKDIIDASLAENYEDKAVHWASVRTLVQWEWGMLPLPSAQKIFLKNILVGSRFSLYNEGARAWAWNGFGAGIPTMSYKWYSEIFFDRGIYLSRLLKPESRFTFPISGDLGNMAPAQYTHASELSPMFNYIEAMEAELARQRQYYKLPEMAHGKMDVAVCYLNDATSSQQAKIAAFEQEYGDVSKLDLAWRNKMEPGFHRKFAKAALPWMGVVIAKSPAVASHDPLPNENAVNDGALTAAQQLGLRDGQSILAPESKYGALIINRSAIDARLPDIVGKYELFPGRDHYNAVKGDPKQWDWMNQRVIARVDAMREEERTYVLTDKDKREILDMLGPPNGDFYEQTEWDGTRHRRIANYVLYTNSSSIKWTQDPLNTGQRNRIRVVGTGKLATYVGWWSSLFNAYDYDPKQWDDSKYTAWNVDEQFIIRRGEVWLVAN